MRDRSRRFFARPLTPRSGGPLASVPGWVWLVVVAYLVYNGLISDHSLLHIFKLRTRYAQVQHETAKVKKESEGLQEQVADPEARRFRAEEIARTKHGWSAPGEVIYRFGDAKADTTRI